MQIQELINNDEFSFNPSFRIYEYEPSEFGSEEEGKLILQYDSDTDIEFNTDLYYQYISAINQANDGAVEIEYTKGGSWLN